MGWWNDLTFRLQSLVARQTQEDDLDEELRFHLEMEIERRMANGESRAEARRNARLDFGAPESIKDQVRDAWGVRLADETWRDVQGALRMLVRFPVFSTVSVGSLALGLATATVIFSLADAVMLRPLPYHDPGALVSVEEVTPAGMPFSISEANWIDFATTSRLLDGMGAWNWVPSHPALALDGERVKLHGEVVSASFFPVLGVRPRLGRTFDPEIDGGGEAPRQAVLTDRGWRRHFAADPDVVGRSINLDGEPWTVIGVLPEDFLFRSGEQDIYLPYVVRPEFQRGNRYLGGLARLADGVHLEQARDEMDAIAQALEAQYPQSNSNWDVRLLPLDHFLLGDEQRQAHLMLLGAALLLMLLACANVSNLLLARASDRRDEIQLRLCLGAGRGRLRRQLLVESLVLTTAGALVAVLLAIPTIPWIRRLDIALPRLDQVHLGARSLAFLALATLLSGLLCGLASALRISARGAGLRARRQGSDKGSRRLRSALVASEVALAVVLTVGAGLLLRSFEQLRAFDAGFHPSGVLLARIDLPVERYPDGEKPTRMFFERVMEQLQGLAGVEAVGGSSASPFRDGGTMNRVALETEVERDNFLPIHWRSITADYFDAVGIPLLRGRNLAPASTQRLEAVISASLAERLWPDGDAVGKRLRWIRPKGPLLDVVGVVGNVQDQEIGGERTDMVYWPQYAMGRQSFTLTLRTDLEPEVLYPAVRQAVRAVDPMLAPPEFSTLEGQRARALASPLLSLRIVTFSALIALLLAAAGVYGMVAYSVSRRRREMGVRAALGAKPGQLISLVVRDAAALLAGGLIGGLLISLGLTRTLGLLLYQTSPLDPQVFAVVVAVLAVVGLLASCLPAMGAGRVDPLTVLRQD